MIIKSQDGKVIVNAENVFPTGVYSRRKTSSNIFSVFSVVSNLMSRRKMIFVSALSIINNDIIAYNTAKGNGYITLGSYSTEKRALQVLDMLDKYVYTRDFFIRRAETEHDSGNSTDSHKTVKLYGCFCMPPDDEKLDAS